MRLLLTLAVSTTSRKATTMAKDPYKNLKDAAEAHAITTHLSGGTGKGAEMSERALRNAEKAAEKAGKE